MLLLALGLVIFLGLHSTRIFAEGWRTATIARFGAMPYKAVYSLVSIAGFALIVVGYGMARQQPVMLWTPPGFTRHIAALLMLPVFVLFVAAYVPGNGIRARLGHPQILSVKLWALAHLLANGTLAGVMLFGSFLAWAVLDFRAAKGRDRLARAAIDDPWNVKTGFYKPDEIAGAGSPSPQPSPQRSQGAKTAITVVIGMVVYALFVGGLHRMLIGVRPY